MRYILGSTFAAIALASGMKSTASHDSSQSLDSGSASSNGASAQGSLSLDTSEAVDTRVTRGEIKRRDFRRPTSAYSPAKLTSRIMSMTRHFDASSLIQRLPWDKRDQFAQISQRLEEAARQALLWWIKYRQLFGEVSDAMMDQEVVVRDALESYPEPQNLDQGSDSGFANSADSGLDSGSNPVSGAEGSNPIPEPAGSNPISAAEDSTALSEPEGADSADPVISEVKRIAFNSEWTPTLRLEHRFAKLAEKRINTIVDFVKTFSRLLISAKRSGLRQEPSDLFPVAMREADRITKSLIDKDGPWYSSMEKEWFSEGHVAKRSNVVEYNDSVDDSDVESSDDSDNGSNFDDDRVSAAEQAKLQLHNELVSCIHDLRSAGFPRAQFDLQGKFKLMADALDLAAVQELEWFKHFGRFIAIALEDYALNDTASLAFNSYGLAYSNGSVLNKRLLKDPHAARVHIESLLAADNTDDEESRDVNFEAQFSAAVSRRIRELTTFLEKFTNALMPQLDRHQWHPDSYRHIAEALEEAEATHGIYSSRSLGLMKKWENWLTEADLANERAREERESLQMVREEYKIRKDQQKALNQKHAEERKEKQRKRDLLLAAFAALDADRFDLTDFPPSLKERGELIVNALNGAAQKALHWVQDCNGYMNELSGVGPLGSQATNTQRTYDARATRGSKSIMMSRRLLAERSLKEESACSSARPSIEELLAFDPEKESDLEPDVFAKVVEYRAKVLQRTQELTSFLITFANELMPTMHVYLTHPSDTYENVTEALEKAEAIHSIYSSESLGLVEQFRVWQADDELQQPALKSEAEKRRAHEAAQLASLETLRNSLFSRRVRQEI